MINPEIKEGIAMAKTTTTKPKPPALKDWRGQVENKIKLGGSEKRDVLEIIWLAQDLLREMEPPNRWISEHGQYLNGIVSDYMRLYGHGLGSNRRRDHKKKRYQRYCLIFQNAGSRWFGTLH